MKIIVIGAGKVGAGLAEYLINENNEITLIDMDINKLRELQNRYDIKIVKGHGSYPETLRNADAANTELLVAVTDSDETNMLACQLGYSLFRIPQKIARIRNHEYLSERKILFCNQAIPIDNIIAPEQLITDEIANLISYPGVLQIAEFASGRVAIASAKAYYGGPIVGYQLDTMRNHLDSINASIVAIYRQNRLIQLKSDTVIEAGDEVVFISAIGHIRSVMSEFQRLEVPYRRIMIIGGGSIGMELARKLGELYQIKLIEMDEERAEFLASEFDKSSVEVFCSNPSNPDFLTEEHVDEMDLVIAVTEKDETNIMSTLLAKKLGAQKSIVLISNFAYVNLLQTDAIDIVLSPHEATISALLTNIRHNGVDNVHTLRRGTAECLEITINGTTKNNAVLGKPLAKIKFPVGISLCAIYRNEEVIMASPDLELASGDLAIFFVTEKKNIRELIKMTAPRPSFFAKTSEA